MEELIQFYNKYYKPGNVCTDTRIIKKGQIFVALSGKNFNGNEYARKALDSGASVAVTEDPALAGKRNFYRVENTLDFLQKLAAYHRKKSNFKVIVLTGTNGKTTTKELIKNIIAKKYSCKATEGNLNNHIGVPMTLLSIPSNTQYAVIEIGANHPGEIKDLCEIASPDSGLITNIGLAHLEGFGSFEGVIKAKSELYNYLLAKSGKIYLNGADKILSKLLKSYKNKVLYNVSNGICSGELNESYPRLNIKITYFNQYDYTLESQLYGDYNLENILAAACIGADLGIPFSEINKGIEEYVPLHNRSEILHFGSIHLILDCYNANPTSMKQALQSFSKLKAKKKLVVLGSMKELGTHSKQEHENLVKLVKTLKLNRCILVGEEFFSSMDPSFTYLSSYNDLTRFLNPHKLNDYTILVKGSRANQLERITEVFENPQRLQ